MKAVLLETLGPIESSPIRLADYEIPTPGPRQVLLKVHACGVCRSNLHMIEGDWANHGVPAKLPIVPGHEVVGSIVELGGTVDELSVGDRVGVQPLWWSCGRCEFCQTGREQLCLTKEITGETVDGGYAQYMVANADHVYRVPESLSDAEAAPLFCPGVTAFGAVAKAGITPGQQVAVFGVGGVGHLVIELALMAGAQVTAVARSEAHLELATDLGAQHVIESEELWMDDHLKSLGGFDAAIVFAPSSEVIQQAIQSLKPGGIAVLGVRGDLGELSFEQKRITNTLIGSRHEMNEVLRLASLGKINASVESFPLEDAEVALTRLKNGKIRARAVLVV